MIRRSLLMQNFSILFGLFFALQVLAAFGPSHMVHAGHHHRVGAANHAVPNAPGSNSRSPSLPEECQCDLCLAFGALDPGSVSQPPVFQLIETVFSVVAAYPSFIYSTPVLFSPARGPPVFA